jgi:hypothetical protein
VLIRTTTKIDDENGYDENDENGYDENDDVEKNESDENGDMEV